MALRHEEIEQVNEPLDTKKQTILLYSPDLNFCFSLSVLFQDRYNVVTTTNLGMLEKFIGMYGADLVLLDAVPSRTLIDRIDALRVQTSTVPVLLLYVYTPRDAEFDGEIRKRVDTVYYKPVEIDEVSKRVFDLLERKEITP